MSDAEIRRNVWDRAANTWRRLIDTTTIAWDISTPGQASAGVPNGGIDTDQLADGAVTADKIAPGVVPTTAADISYDNGTSGLSADDVQDAIDEVEGRVDTLEGAAVPGLVLLNSGTVDDDATLDIVLTSFTAYRALKFVLSGFVPATDDVELWMRFSTDGGSNFDATGYSFDLVVDNDADADTPDCYRSTSANQIPVAAFNFANLSVSNTAAEGGADVEVTIHKPSVSRWTRARISYAYTSADSRTITAHGAGTRETQQDTNAVRFLFESGNIASGDWALYGYA